MHAYRTIDFGAEFFFCKIFVIFLRLKGVHWQINLGRNSSMTYKLVLPRLPIFFEKTFYLHLFFGSWGQWTYSFFHVTCEHHIFFLDIGPHCFFLIFLSILFDKFAIRKHHQLFKSINMHHQSFCTICLHH